MNLADQLLLEEIGERIVAALNKKAAEFEHCGNLTTDEARGVLTDTAAWVLENEIKAGRLQLGPKRD